MENGHTVPSVETLEKFARALEVPMYELFYDGEEQPKLRNLPKRKSAEDSWLRRWQSGRVFEQHIVLAACLTRHSGHSRRIDDGKASLSLF